MPPSFPIKAARPGPFPAIRSRAFHSIVAYFFFATFLAAGFFFAPPQLFPQAITLTSLRSPGLFTMLGVHLLQPLQ